MALALKVDWVAVRTAIETGASYEQTAKIFGVPVPTLRQRAKRGGWMSPGVVEKLSVSAESANVTPMSRDQVKTAITETWAEKGAKLRRVMFKKAFNAVKASTVQSPKNWRDLEIADKLARRAAGLDTADNQVNLSFSLPGWGQNARVFDADSGAYSGTSSEEETQSPPTAIEDSGGD
jgi:hypothetical protein